MSPSHQAIIWINVDFLLVRFCGIQATILENELYEIILLWNYCQISQGPMS